MKLSTKGRYGLRAMVELSADQDEGPLSLAAIAQRQDVSEAYLEQLMRTLKFAELVTTERGKTGGYLLARPASEISVKEILTALEGSTVIADCVGTEKSVCEKACRCAARPLFLTLQNRIDDVLKSTTLQDLTDDYLEQKKRIEHGESLS